MEDELNRETNILPGSFWNTLSDAGIDLSIRRGILRVSGSHSSCANDPCRRPPKRVSDQARTGGDDSESIAVEDVRVFIDPQDVAQLFGALYTAKNGDMGMGASYSHPLSESYPSRESGAANDRSGATFSFFMLQAAEEAIDVNKSGAIQNAISSTRRDR